MGKSKITVAGREVKDAFQEITSYANKHWRTVATYDLAERPATGSPLTRDEVAVTRVIASRISNAQADAMVASYQRNEGLWRSAELPADLDLADLTFPETDQHYAAMLALYNSLIAPGISDAKISKVLHRRWPKAFPILDSRVRAAYRSSGAVSRSGNRSDWRAIHDDLVHNKVALDDLSAELARDPESSHLTALSNVRLLDIMTW